MAIHRRPAGMLEDRSQLQAERGSDFRPHNLQEKRLVEFPTDERVLLHLVRSAGDDKPIDHFLADRGFQRGLPRMNLRVHGNRNVGMLPQESVTADVMMRQRAFEHHQVVELFEFLAQPRGVGGIDAEPVEIHIDFEMIGQRFAELPALLTQVPPGRPLVLKLV